MLSKLICERLHRKYWRHRKLRRLAFTECDHCGRIWDWRAFVEPEARYVTREAR